MVSFIPQSFFVDVKKWESKEVLNLDPSKIASINLIKGLSTKDKYGEDGKNGVVEITLKK
jgi:bla regulator protein BlaR1